MLRRMSEVPEVSAQPASSSTQRPKDAKEQGAEVSRVYDVRYNMGIFELNLRLLPKGLRPSFSSAPE